MPRKLGAQLVYLPFHKHDFTYAPIPFFYLILASKGFKSELN